MKWISIIIASAGIIGLGFISKNKTLARSKVERSVTIQGDHTPVAVLELFTSEGCSSCPSADNLLPQLAKADPNIIPLSFHVDYWNRLGWTDPFSSSKYSDRQSIYSQHFNLESIYTPQLVINGEYELVGSNRSDAESTIKEALAEKQTVQLKMDDVKMTGTTISFTVHTEGDIKKTDLLAALVQKSATINVKAGENMGAKLSHTNVVRVFEKQTAADKNEFQLELPSNIEKDNWELILYTQHKNNLKITGALRYSPSVNK